MVMKMELRLLGANVLVRRMVQMLVLVVLLMAAWSMMLVFVVSCRFSCCCSSFLMASLIAGLSFCVLMFLSVVSGLGSGGTDGTMKLGVYVGGFAAHGVPLMVSMSCWSYLSA